MYWKKTGPDSFETSDKKCRVYFKYNRLTWVWSTENESSPDHLIFKKPEEAVDHYCYTHNINCDMPVNQDNKTPDQIITELLKSYENYIYENIKTDQTQFDEYDEVMAPIWKQAREYIKGKQK